MTRTRGWRRRGVQGLFLALLLVLGLPAGGLLLVNLALNTALPRLLNLQPERRQFTWDLAWMWTPGTVHVRGLQVRVQSSLDQWLLTADAATAVVDLEALRHHRFEADGVRADGVAFFYRVRVDTNPVLAPVDGAPSPNPDIPGLQNPPDPAPEALYPSAEAPWAISLRGIVADDVRELWFGEYHFTGDATVVGDLAVVDGQSFAATAGGLDVERGAVHIGDAPVLEAMRGRADFSLGPVDPRVDTGAAVLRHLDAHLTLDARTTDARFLATYLVEAPFLGVDAGGGSLQLDLGVARGVAEVGSWATFGAEDLVLGLLSYRITGDGEVHFEVAEGVDGPESRLTIDFRDFAVGTEGASVPHVRGSGFRATARSPDVALDRPLRELTARFELPDSEVPDVRVYNAYLPADAGFVFEQGSARFRGHLDVTTPANRVSGAFVVDGRAVRARLGDLAVQGQAVVRGRLVDGSIDEGRYHIGGSRLELREVEVVRADGSPTHTRPTVGWWADLDVPSGTVRPGSSPYLSADLALRVRDTAPVVTLFTARKPLPDWVRRIFDVEAVEGTSTVALADDRVTLSRLALTGGPMEVLARLVLDPTGPEGSLFARYGALSVGAALRAGEVRLQLLDPRAWFEAGGAPPPAGEAAPVEPGRREGGRRRKAATTPAAPK